jgi:hypothetical protein
MDRQLSVSEDFAESDLAFAKNDKSLSGLFFANVDFSSDRVLSAMEQLRGYEYRKVTLFNPTGSSLDYALHLILTVLTVDTFVLEYTGSNDTVGADDNDNDGSSSTLRDKDAYSIGDALCNGSRVKKLYFKGVPRLKSLGIALKVGLSHSQSITSFVWSHHRDLIIHPSALQSSTHIDDNNRDFWYQLCHGLENCKNLQRLEIRQSEQDEIISQLLVSLRNHKSLRHITICVSTIGHAIERALERLCESNCCSHAGSVSPLERIKIRIRGQLLRIPALPSNGRIKYMLEPWFANDGQMDILGAGLHRNDAIDELDLRYHSLSCLGVKTLASWLPEARSLGKLILEGRLIREEGAAALLVAMRDHEAWLEVVSIPRSCPYRCQIQHYADLTKAGWNQLRQDPNMLPALWPIVLARASKLAYCDRHGKENQARQMNVLYQLLHGPVTFDRLKLDIAT